LLFAEQNARIPQMEHPTEFLASVLKRETVERDEVVVVFGAGNERLPPRPAYGFEIVDTYLAQGWRYWYSLHNHTRQADGTLGVPVPSTSVLHLARNLAESTGLACLTITYVSVTYDVSVD